MDTGEPFGLPRGTVRGIIALGVFALLGYSYISTNIIDPVLLAFAGPYLGFYFGTRPSELPVPLPVVLEEVDPPFIPGETDA